MNKLAYIHFRNRCRERFGITLSEKQVEEIEQCCRDGSYYKIEDQRPGVALYRVQMGREMSAVAYDGDRRTVLTILPIAWTGRAYRMERKRALEVAEAAVSGTVEREGGKWPAA